MKVLNTKMSNSGNTLDKAINITYNMYSAYKNDSILINYGDSTSQTIGINSGSYF